VRFGGLESAIDHNLLVCFGGKGYPDEENRILATGPPGPKTFFCGGAARAACAFSGRPSKVVTPLPCSIMPIGKLRLFGECTQTVADPVSMSSINGGATLLPCSWS